MPYFQAPFHFSHKFLVAIYVLKAANYNGSEKQNHAETQRTGNPKKYVYEVYTV